MPPKKNPKNLNGLQLRTLAILQELARDPDHGAPADEPGSVMVTNLPHPHGDHFHVGRQYVVASRDATGLSNQAVWVALERKGLAKGMFPMAIVLTEEALSYDTGVRDQILHGHNH